MTRNKSANVMSTIEDIWIRMFRTVIMIPSYQHGELTAGFLVVSMTLLTSSQLLREKDDLSVEMLIQNKSK